MMKLIWNRLLVHKNIIDCMMDDEEIIDTIYHISMSIVNSIKSGGKVLICGNGGSAADSQHLATELISRFYYDRKAINAEALTVNTSSLTAIGNDYDFNRVFSRQVEAKGRSGDVLLGISTSGSSTNVIEAFGTARKLGMKCFGLAGNSRCKMDDVCELVFHAPSDDTPRIQEIHILVGHIICEIVEKEMMT